MNLHLLGRLVEASNGTFVSVDDEGVCWVYKPVAGEAPLWDFPARTLGRREVAAYLLSELGGFGVVPETRWVEQAPLGPGSVQRWVEAEGDELVGLVPHDEVPDGWLGMVVGVDEHHGDVAVVHADHPALRQLAFFDAICNNADRKGGHIIRRAEQVFGVDHGVCFHTEPKLRTVLWGWAGEPLEAAELSQLSVVCERGAEALDEWLAPAEVEAVVQRCSALRAAGTMPELGQYWPIPWPIL